jgi:diguanylate cyclase (GGDEF)-like protein/PAS domain S-box-containing protein
VNSLSLLSRQWALALGFGLIALAAVHFTRFDGGVAFLWGSSALLIAALIRTSQRHWWAPLLACGLVNVPITGFFGLGWTAAVPFAILNLCEAIFAAAWLKRRPGSGEVMANLPWFGRFVFAMVAAPMLVGPFIGLTIWLMGGQGEANMMRFITGHALGNVTLTPIAYMLTGRAARSETVRILRKKRVDALVLLPLVGGVCVLTFWQSQWPLLFLPIMWIMLATFRLGRLGAALSLVILAVVGGVFTTLGEGPITLSGAAPGDRIQLFQFYLAATVLTVIPIAADLNSRRKLHRDLKRSEAEFRLLADHCTDVITRISVDGRIRYASPSIALLTGHQPDALVGVPSRNLIDDRDIERIAAEHRATLSSGGAPRSYEYRAKTLSGELRWFSTHARALLDDDGEPFELLAIIRDITASKASEAALSQAAHTDLLTGLPNRRAFANLVAQRQKQGEAGEDCIAILDLDRFKAVNDTHGHDVGDAVLQRFANLAGQLVRSGDTIARLGGEEFVILFQRTDVDQAHQVCDRLRHLLATTPLDTPAGPLSVTVSGGVAPLGDSFEAALRNADHALYRAKRGGRDQMLLAA